MLTNFLSNLNGLSPTTIVIALAVVVGILVLGYVLWARPGKKWPFTH
jgi:hypothetical protein